MYQTLDLHLNIPAYNTLGNAGDKLVDKTIRKNEFCIIGLPRCDFVFSSTRTCFIAYGFEESPLEMSLLRKLLKERAIEAIEAGASLAPGQNAFCTKICSKIITAQFCAVLLNNEELADREIPNANVNMEYGLMLGFNKYVIPFQRASQKLPFNVAGLDTVKYSDRDFERMAADAIDQAVLATQQAPGATVAPDQNLGTFLLAKRVLWSSVTDPGNKNLYEMGGPLGFNLLHDFSGSTYIYFGNFTMLRPEAVLWRLRMLEEILAGRASALPERLEAGMITPKQISVVSKLLDRVQIWVLVTSEDDKTNVLTGLLNTGSTHPLSAFSLADVAAELNALPGAGG